MLPNDEMKGRIIGREGRNIRALETATGVDLIVDDTPEAVILSGFDPFRREVARVALERLIVDGRIHPARIEEIVEKVKAEFEQKILQEGEAALLELGIPGMHPELVKLLGRLRYRTSYGQNVLQHSKEVAFLAGTMAAELRPTSQVARRGGLLHDIGKAIDREMDGTHLQIGIDLLRKYGETEEVVHAMACHHGDYDPQTVEAVLVTAADALSAARPGRPARDPGDLRQAPREAGGDRLQLQGRAEDLRHPGRPRDPHHRRQRQDRRRAGALAVQGHRAEDRGRS